MNRNKDILVVNNVFKKFDHQEKPALNNVSIHIKEGDFISIMGSSGSGKTTLLNSIATLDNPSSGEIFIENEKINNLSSKLSAKIRKNKIGFIFQNYRLLNSLTARENIAISLSLINYPHNLINNKIEKMSEKLKILDQLDKYPYELSGGQQQRVAIVRALIKNPKIILADEPTGALDSNSTKLIMNEIKNVNKEYNTTILMVTHDSLAASYSDKVTFLKDGEIIDTIQNGTSNFNNILASKLSKIESEEG